MESLDVYAHKRPWGYLACAYGEHHQHLGWSQAQECDPQQAELHGIMKQMHLL